MSAGEASSVVRRWLRFNVVGAAGVLVQLVTLAGLGKIAPRQYLWNSLIAVETAVLHNFIAHVHYTWRDRMWRDAKTSRALLQPLWRFQLANGGVSLAGNAALMKVLAGAAHMPVLAANVVAIAACGLANFWLGERWAFRARSKCLWQGVALVLIVMQVGTAVGQQAAPASVQSGAASALTPLAQKIKDDVGRIPVDGKMTVRMLNGVEYHGRLEATEAEQFTVHEVDLTQMVRVRYADVERVSANYGGKGFGGRRVDPKRSMIVGALIVGGLLTLVFVAMASDKS